GLGRRIPERGPHRLARERLEGGGADEAGRGLGHGHPHARAGVAQAADQVRGLVGRDPAADAEQDAFALELALRLVHALGLSRPIGSRTAYLNARRRPAAGAPRIACNGHTSAAVAGTPFHARRMVPLRSGPAADAHPTRSPPCTSATGP